MANAQETGQASFNGITFTVPENWKGARQNNLYLMASDTEAGLIVIIPAAFADLNGIKAELNREQSDGSSIWLSRAKEIESLGEQALGAEFNGTFNLEQATMFVSGVLAGNNRGMMIYAGTSTQMYSGRYKELTTEIIESMHSTPARSTAGGEDAKNSEWEQFYGNTRLTYMDSYYSSSYGDASVSGGYSNKVVIDLCSQGYFAYRNDFEMSGGGNYSSFGSSDGKAGSGTWSITPHSQSTATLVLTFYNGQTTEYTILYDEKGATYLNGDRYYRTTINDQVAEHRPNCF